MGDWEQIFRREGKVFVKLQEDMKDIAALLKKENAKRVLDLGCGTGRHAVFLAKKGFDVYATDMSEAGLKIARKWLEQEKLSAKLKKHSFYKRFPFKDDFFDAVVSTQAIHHNFHEKVRFCISEIERVLKPGGIAFITVSANRYRRRASSFEMPEPRTYIPLDGDEKGLPHFIYSKALMRKDFRNFEVLSLHKDKWDHWCLLGRLKRDKKKIKGKKR